MSPSSSKRAALRSPLCLAAQGLKRSRMMAYKLSTALLLCCSFVVTIHAGVPLDWAPRIKAGNMIYSPTDAISDPFLLPVVANGYLGTVIASEIMYVGGVFNGGDNVSTLNGPPHRAVIPSTVAISVTNANTYATAIDLEYGIYYRRSTLQNNPGVNIEQRWFAHRAIPHLLVHEIYVNNTNNSPAQLNLFLNQSKSSDFSFETTLESNTTIAFNGTTLIPELVGGELTHVAVMAAQVPAQMLAPPQTYSNFQFVTAIATSLDSSNPVASAKAIYQQYYNTALTASHIEAWQVFWESGIEIEGDPYLAAAVNNSLYEILSSIRVDWPYSLSPGGIPTNGYNGHTFWDAETWMYPTLLLLYPDIAREVLQYRYDRLSTSAENAQVMGYKGVKYAWESAFTGIEAVLLPLEEGRLEIHINGDVARAVAQYFFVTQDLEWLNSTGFPIINGIAEYWVSRVEMNTTSGQYVINGVICPDESAAYKNNSVFTNIIASLSLIHATEFAKLLGISPPSIWTQIANNIKIPFDVKLQWHPEYDGYNGETINQADVALLQYPLGIAMSREVAVNDLLYYQNHTDRNGMFTGDCIAWLRLGNPANAEYYFNNTLQHLKPPFLVFTERIVGGIPHFITGAGGFLQNIVFGYTGLQIEDTNITVYPSFLPPSTTTRITIRKFQYLGNTLTISFNATQITFANDVPAYKAKPILGNIPNFGKPASKTENGESELVVVDQNNKTWPFPLGGTLAFPIGKYYILSP